MARASVKFIMVYIGGCKKESEVKDAVRKLQHLCSKGQIVCLAKDPRAAHRWFHVIRDAGNHRVLRKVPQLASRIADWK